MKNKNKIAISITIDKDQNKIIEKAMKKMYISKSALITWALDEFFLNHWPGEIVEPNKKK